MVLINSNFTLFIQFGSVAFRFTLNTLIICIIYIVGKTGCYRRQGDVKLSHMQFVDDTLILGTKCWLNVRSIRTVLLLLQEVLGLKVNFNKSMLTAVNISPTWLAEAASVLNCRTGTIPFLYLGLRIGGDSRKLNFWKPVVDKITSRLSSWNNKFLSFGGRLVLLKYVLSSLPVYFLSFFKAST